MGEVVAVLKVMPDSPEVDLAELRKELEQAIPTGANLQGIDEENVAFGLKALMVTIMMEDVEGGTDTVQESLEGIPHVQSVQVTDVGRV